jgi:DNA-binding MarR family transcriptional regulator
VNPQIKFDLAEYLPYLINRVGMAMIVRFSEDALSGHNVTISMWRVLAVLAHAGPQRQIDISGLSSIDASTLSRIITRLTRMGYVTRKRSSKSNREVIVELTPKAQRLVESSLSVARDLERTAEAGMTATETAMLKDMLRRVHGNLSNAASQAAVSRLLDFKAGPRGSARRGPASKR